MCHLTQCGKKMKQSLIICFKANLITSIKINDINMTFDLIAVLWSGAVCCGRSHPVRDKLCFLQ